MSESVVLVVGRKGEIYTTREIRERVGLMPGGRVLARVQDDNKLVIEPQPSAITLLRKPRIDAEPVNPKELSRMRKELAEKLEQR